MIWLASITHTCGICCMLISTMAILRSLVFIPVRCWFLLLIQVTASTTWMSPSNDSLAATAVSLQCCMINGNTRLWTAYSSSNTLLPVHRFQRQPNMVSSPVSFTDSDVSYCPATTSPGGWRGLFTTWLGRGMWGSACWSRSRAYSADFQNCMANLGTRS